MALNLCSNQNKLFTKNESYTLGILVTYLSYTLPKTLWEKKSKFYTS